MPQEKPLGQRNYEQFADRYAEATPTKPHNAYYEWPATRSLVPDVEGKRVLDAGCGPGHYARWLIEHRAEVIGIDVTPEMVAIAQAAVNGKADILLHDLEQPLTFAEDGEFDGVLCPLVLDYIKDLTPVFKEFARVLKQGGWLVFSCMHPQESHRLFTEQIDSDSRYFDVQLGTFTWNGFGEPKPQVTHYRRPLSDILNPLAQAQFMLERIIEPLPTPEFGRINPEEYERLHKMPVFICMRARKV